MNNLHGCVPSSSAIAHHLIKNQQWTLSYCPDMLSVRLIEIITWRFFESKHIKSYQPFLSKQKEDLGDFMVISLLCYICCSYLVLVLDGAFFCHCSYFIILLSIYCWWDMAGLNLYNRYTSVSPIFDNIYIFVTLLFRYGFHLYVFF